MLSSADDAVIQGPTLLIVEDDVGFARALAMLARDAGFIPTIAGTVSQAKQHAGRQRFDITVIDVNLPDGSGLALFECSELSQARRVLITGAYNVHNMLRAARLHVPDVLTKPVAADLLRDLLADARAKLNATAVAAESFYGLTVASDAARDTVRCVKRLAPLPVSVCLSGEPGVGKKSLARALHEESGRTGECVFVDAELHAESTERQATGTENLPRQWVRRAKGGTLVLERLEALPRRMQAQLASALSDDSGEEGADDVRVISVCHLPGGWTTAHLRPDLLYRVTGVVVDVAPLRRRREDISAIAADTIAQLNARYGTTKYLTHRAAQALSQYSWPGNVYELRSVLEQSFHTAHPQ